MMKIPNNYQKYNTCSKIAMLIDSDNTSHQAIDSIMEDLSQRGEVNIRRAYGNWNKSALKGWESKLREHAISPVQQFDHKKGKNTTDICMIIEAMKILYEEDIDCFVLLSSDSDFTQLVIMLREKGKKVLCYGNQNATKAFRSSCSEFIAVKNVATESKNRTLTTQMYKKELRQDTKLVNALRDAVGAKKDKDGWSYFGNVIDYIKVNKLISWSTYGYSNPRELFEEIDLFKFIWKKSESELWICDKRDQSLSII